LSLRVLRILTAGESHGPALTGIMEGVIAGLSLTSADIDPDLKRRQAGYGRSGRQVIEKDHAEISSGVAHGRTTGAPITLTIENRDWKNWKDKQPERLTVPRPGHADLSGSIKYRYDDLRIALERASARETATRVALGAIARRLLSEFGISVASQVVELGDVTGPGVDLSIEDNRTRVEESLVRSGDPESEQAMIAAIDRTRKAKDTLGGIISVEAFGVPPGLGSHVHWDRKLDGRLAGAMMSIQAIKGVEIGLGFDGARTPGSKLHDPIEPRDGRHGEFAGFSRPSNNAGGLEGGVTNGQPVVVRIAMKPISTLLQGMESVDLYSGEAKRATYQRSDICAVPAAGVVGEAMMCLVLADAFLEKFGGDSLDELREHVSSGW
jgi:chorismate synthase